MALLRSRKANNNIHGDFNAGCWQKEEEEAEDDDDKVGKYNEIKLWKWQISIETLYAQCRRCFFLFFIFVLCLPLLAHISRPHTYIFK